ncbi:MAG: DUF3568 family protein [Planctomycetota bacterium]
MTGRRLLVLPVLVLLVVGCAPLYQRTDPDTGVGYKLGELRATVEAPPARVAAAARLAFERLEIRERFADASGLDAELIGRTARTKKVKVVVKAAGQGRSTVYIRIGTFGDRDLSRTLLDTIRDALRPGAVPR